jgi:hypothetical protein
MAFPGCGLLDGGERLFGGSGLAVPDGCSTLYDVDIPARIAAARPDLVVVVTSFWDVTDHRWPDDGDVDADALRRACSRSGSSTLPRVQHQRARREHDAAKVVWVQYPASTTSGRTPTSPQTTRSVRRARVHHPRRGRRRRRSVRVIESRSGCAASSSTRPRGRPDGVHFTLERRRRDAGCSARSSWLAADVARRDRRSRTAAVRSPRGEGAQVAGAGAVRRRVRHQRRDSRCS